MKRIVACVDSYYQLLIAVNLRYNKFNLHKFDLILINSMQNAESVYFNIKKIGIFDNVFLINSHLNINKLNTSFLQRLPKYYDYVYSIINFEKYSKIKLNVSKIPYYDIFLFNGYKPLIQCLFNAYYKKNNKIKCYRIDDGTASYIQEWCVKKSVFRRFIENIAGLLFNFQNIEKYILGFYVPDKNLIKYKVPYKLLCIPDYSDLKLINSLNSIFELKKELFYVNKYIVYFGGYGSAEIKDDFLLLNEIIKIIPKKYILLKPHPRVPKETYDSLNLDVVTQSMIPWELYMMNFNFNNSVFISQMSSAVLSARIIFNRKGTDIYLYNCLMHDKNKNEIFYNFTKFLREYRAQLNISNQILIPSSIDSFNKILIKEKNNAEKD